MDVEQPKLEVQDRFARDAEAKMSRLDDAGVNGSDRHLKHPFAGHGSKWMEVSGDARHDPIVRKVLAERPRSIRPVVVKRDTCRIRMALGDEAEEIHDLAFEPVRRRILRGDRRVGRRGRVDRRGDMEKCPMLRQRPDVMDDEAACRVALVTREQ